MDFRKKWFLENGTSKEQVKRKNQEEIKERIRESIPWGVSVGTGTCHQSQRPELHILRLTRQRDPALTRPSWPLCMLYGTPVHTQFPQALRNKWKIKGDWGREETKWRAKPVIGFSWKLRWEGQQTAAMDSMDSWCPNGPAMSLSLCFLTLTYKIILEWKNVFSRKILKQTL